MQFISLPCPDTIDQSHSHRPSWPVPHAQTNLPSSTRTVNFALHGQLELKSPNDGLNVVLLCHSGDPTRHNPIHFSRHSLPIPHTHTDTNEQSQMCLTLLTSPSCPIDTLDQSHPITDTLDDLIHSQKTLDQSPTPTAMHTFSDTLLTNPIHSHKQIWPIPPVPVDTLPVDQPNQLLHAYCTSPNPTHSYRHSSPTPLPQTLLTLQQPNCHLKSLNQTRITENACKNEGKANFHEMW